MNLLQQLQNMLHHNNGNGALNQVPRQGQPQVPFSNQAAAQYNANPQQFAGRNAVDPRYFNYPADNSGRLRVQQANGAQPLNGGYNPQTSVSGRFQQPSGPSFEDEYTAMTAAQPVDYRTPQTSINGAFYQGPESDQTLLRWLSRR